MSFAIALTVASLLGTPGAALEHEAFLHIQRDFERVGRSAPAIDAALSNAARNVAADALDHGASQSTQLIRVMHAISSSGAHDPSPRTYVSTGPREEALGLFRRRSDFSAEPATHIGVGAVSDPRGTAIVALLTKRRADLEAFPRSASKGGLREALCGQLAEELSRPTLFLTRPDGRVEGVALHKPGRAHPASAGPSFCATLPLRQAGRYQVEVLGTGERGPEVAALFFIDVGGAGGAQGAALFSEPADERHSHAALLARINALRSAHRLAPLSLDPALSAVAQRYSDAMARNGFFGHRDPQGRDLRDRLAEARYRYVTAGENLGQASGPMAAHFGIEHSPGHRKQLLEPGYQRVGIGVAFRTDRGRREAILTELLARPLGGERESDPLDLAYRALAERRMALKLPGLSRDRTLEAIAKAHAARALAAGAPKSSLDGESLHQRVFQALPAVKAASVDIYIADDPSLVTDSKNLVDGKNRLLGVGAARGDSPTFGRNKFWMVVIYAN